MYPVAPATWRHGRQTVHSLLCSCSRCWLAAKSNTNRLVAPGRYRCRNPLAGTWQSSRAKLAKIRLQLTVRLPTSTKIAVRMRAPRPSALHAPIKVFVACKLCVKLAVFCQIASDLNEKWFKSTILNNLIWFVDFKYFTLIWIYDCNSISPADLKLNIFTWQRCISCLKFDI